MIVGIYGGTFDPIHFGHLNLAVGLKEVHNLDEVWFIPAYISPHRMDEEAVAPHHRLAMTRAALADIPDFKVLDTEITRGGPSYTIDTLRDLPEGHTYRLILSDEAAPHLDRWKEPEEIIKLAPPLVGRRIGGKPPTTGNPTLDTALAAGYTKTPLFEVSATIVRDRLSKGLTCNHLLPFPVLDYIKKHSLYI